MAPAAAKTLMTYLKNFKETPDIYDLILTRDLGRIVSQLFLEILKKNHKIFSIFGKFLAIYEQKSTSTANIYRRIIFQSKLFFLEKEVSMIRNLVLKVERRNAVWKKTTKKNFHFDVLSVKKELLNKHKDLNNPKRDEYINA